MIVRVLKVPSKGGKDEEGRELGDDWLLADFGCTQDDDGNEYCVYLTTNRLRASEDLPFLEPEPLARWMADHINKEYGPKMDTNVLRIFDISLTNCPTCGPDGVLDMNGRGEASDSIWCEECGWSGKVEELME